MPGLPDLGKRGRPKKSWLDVVADMSENHFTIKKDKNRVKCT
jgi:hypothetical protein